MYPYSELGPAQVSQITSVLVLAYPKIETDKDWNRMLGRQGRTNFGLYAQTVYEIDNILVSSPTQQQESRPTYS
jgi:hypothetical protein